MPFLKINGIDLHYEVHGSGEPLVLIHGLGSSLEDWAFQVPAFQREFQVITCDCRGHGKSSKQRKASSIELFANDMAELIAHLRIRPPHVVGISMGGMIAMELALNHPKSLQTLTLVNCVPNVVVRPVTLLKRWFVLNILGMKSLARRLARSLLPDPQQHALRDELIKRWQQNDRRSYKSATHAILEWSAIGRLSAITVPVAVVSSEYDYWSLDLKKRLFQPVPDITFYELSRAHHLPTLEYPEAFNTLLYDILRSFPGKAPG
ncbi:hypothetical protein BVX99_00255 [bacterium F16]|nr:hypothetical protein BVX99_00255 [bacterium F16]